MLETKGVGGGMGGRERSNKSRREFESQIDRERGIGLEREIMREV
jgi:hypothetical protein